MSNWIFNVFLSWQPFTTQLGHLSLAGTVCRRHEYILPEKRRSNGISIPYGIPISLLMKAEIFNVRVQAVTVLVDRKQEAAHILRDRCSPSRER